MLGIRVEGGQCFPAHAHEEVFMALQITQKDLNKVIVLELAGRVVLGDESSKLRTTVRELLASGKVNLVLDLGSVSYVDSAGLGTLVSCFTSARNQGGVVKLARLTPKMTDQLNITKLVTVFETFDTADAAVASFK
jgi:anti-sigma B factor antagonist